MDRNWLDAPEADKHDVLRRFESLADGYHFAGQLDREKWARAAVAFLKEAEERLDKSFRDGQLSTLPL